MKVTVLSMSEAQHYIPNGKSAIIRVTDGGYELNQLNYPYDYVLSMSFYDIEPRVGLPNNWNWFNKSDGETLLNAFREIEGCDELVVHCYAGISRSSAIALSYGWYKNDLKIVESIKNGKYLPNMQVLNIMSKLIFNDTKTRRDKLDEISRFYKQKVNDSANKEIKL